MTQVQDPKIPEACGDHLLVRRAVNPDRTKQGIIIPEKAKKRPPCYGTVLAAGPEVRNVEVGEIVLFDEQESRYIEYGDTNLLVLAECSVYARFPHAKAARSAGLELA